MSILKEWERVTNKLVKEFCLKYFERDDYDWVAGCVGDVFEIDGYYFNLDRVTDAIKYNATLQQIIDFQDLEINFAFKQDAGEDVQFFSFKNYVLYGDKTPIKEMIGKLQ